MRLFSFFLIILLSTGLVCNQAYAKRFGGGRSFGVQRSAHSYNKSSSSYNSNMRNNTNKTRWGGLLGGLLIGGLLGSLFMSNGLGSGIFTWLILGVAVYLLVNFMRNRAMPQRSFTGNTNQFNQASMPFNNFSRAQSSNSNFSNEDLIRDAKALFIRLQTAYDAKNLSDIREFTSPEVFAEISLQLQEDPDASFTRILQLDVELLDEPNDANANTASVRFTGRVNENNKEETINETWHIRQDSSLKWIVYGVQQNLR